MLVPLDTKASRATRVSTMTFISTPQDGVQEASGKSPISRTDSPSSVTSPPLRTVPSSTSPVLPFDLSNADLSFPPVRDSTNMPRRYTRRITKPNISRPQHHPSFYFVVGSNVFAILWTFVLFMHIACAIYLGWIGSVYFYMLGTTLIGYLTLYRITVDPFYFPPIGAAFFVICGIHAFAMSSIVFHTIRARRQAFTSSHMQRTVTTPRILIRRLSSTALSSLEYRTQSILRRLPSPFARFCYRLWHGVTKIYHVVDLRNEYHGGVYLTRVVIQMIAHTYCAYEASTVASHHWMNDLRVSLMVANSWIIPSLQLFVRKTAPQIRLVCILLNVMLDIVAVYVIPFVIMHPHSSEYDSALTNFPEDKWYTDKWFAVIVFHFRFLGVSSVTTFLARISITYNVARSLRFISLMLRKEEREQANGESTQKMTIAVAAAIHPVPSPPDRRSLSSSTASLLSDSKEKLKQQIRRRCLRLELVHSAILIALGAVVLRVHLKSRELDDRAACSTPVYPWFAVKPSCLFLEFNCEKLGLVGAEDELDWFLEQFDERHIGYLSIRHCPFVQMPPRIIQLTNLVGLKLYKSAVHSWNADAALTSTDHPNLRLLILADVNVSEFPEGLLSTDFPQELLDIEFVRCNLTDLPSNLDERWPKRAVLVFEHMPFQTFPLTLTRLQPASISLAMSNIDSVPAEMMDNMYLYYIVLNGNPIKTLPSPVHLGTRMYWLSIISTELSSLPADYSQLINIDAGNTPYCTALLASSVVPKNVDCASSPPSQLTMFPIEREEELNE